MRAPSTAEASPRNRWSLWLPPTGVILLLSLLGLRGPSDPLTIAAGLLASVLAGAALLDRVPVTAWWLVPISMAVFLPTPFQLYDVILGALAGLAILAWLRRPTHSLRLDRIEIAYLLFLAGTATTLFGPFDWRRWSLAIRLYGTGLPAFELARRGARRYGSVATLWGPLGFGAITTCMLVSTAHRVGSATSLLLKHRTELAALPWGNTNYVAAILVLLLPGALYIARDATARALERRLGSLAIAMILAALVLTTSRGGLLLGAGYLVAVGTSGRRGLQAVAAGILVVAALLYATTFGQTMASRFTDPEQLPSVLIRIDIWRAAWERGVTHLPFGVGFGQGVLQNDRLAEYDPHSFYLTLFSEGGPLALVLCGTMMVALWRVTSRMRTAPADHLAAHALRATMVLALLNALFEPTLSGSLYQALFWWMIGIFEAGASAPSGSPILLVTEPADDTAPRPPAAATAR